MFSTFVIFVRPYLSSISRISFPDLDQTHSQKAIDFFPFGSLSVGSIINVPATGKENSRCMENP